MTLISMVDGAKALAYNCDDVSICEVALLLVRTLACLLHLGVKVESNVGQLLQVL